MSDDPLLMCGCCRAACQHIIEEKDAEIARFRLTDAERALLAMLADHPRTHQIMPHEVATIRGLLERIGGGE